MVSGYDAKKLLKSANIWQSYSKNKSGPVFLTHSVVTAEVKKWCITGGYFLAKFDGGLPSWQCSWQCCRLAGDTMRRWSTQLSEPARHCCGDWITVQSMRWRTDRQTDGRASERCYWRCPGTNGTTGQDGFAESPTLGHQRCIDRYCGVLSNGAERRCSHRSTMQASNYSNAYPACCCHRCLLVLK